MLQVEQLYTEHDQQHILKGLSFDIAAGELSALLGPSGCGKTTLLRSIAGFQPITSGTVTLNHQDITHLPADKRGIGFVFQHYALFPHMTVADNILFGIHRSGQKQQRLDELLALTDLTSMARRYPHELSGGQQQRVALARALAPKPGLLLLDEPFSNLDTDLRKSLNMRVRDILKETGTTAILVTHDQSEAFAFGDTVGVVHNGQIQQWDTPFHLYHQPATPFIAEFIGHGTLIQARVSHGKLDTDFGSIEHTQTLKSDVQTLRLLSRPDDWQITPDDERFTIIAKRFEGTQTTYTVSTQDNKQIDIASPGHQNYAIGSQIGLIPQFDHIVTF